MAKREQDDFSTTVWCTAEFYSVVGVGSFGQENLKTPTKATKYMWKSL